MIQVQGSHFSGATAVYWDELMRCRQEVALPYEVLFPVRRHAANGCDMERWTRALQAVALPRSARHSRDAVVFNSGSEFVSKASVLLSRAAKQHPHDFWHLHYFAARARCMRQRVFDEGVAADVGRLRVC